MKDEEFDFESIDDMELDDLFAEFHDEDGMGDEKELSERSKKKAKKSSAKKE